jgi:GT2 family glycosyltransferase
MGLPTYYAPEAIVRHVGSATAGTESGFTVYHVHRNLVWCYVTNMPGRTVWLYLPIHLLTALIFLVYYLKHGLGKSYLQAKRDAMRGLGKAVSKRKQIQGKRKANPGTIIARMDHGLFSPFLLGRSSKRLRQWLGKRTPKGEV